MHKNFNFQLPLPYIFAFVFFISCGKKKPLFEKINPESSGIHFNNQVDETPYFNVLNYEYIYNGGGVGIGDFNNDSLPDIYFTGSRVSNKLYLNKGNLKFDDVTALSNTNGEGKWCKGVAVVDINNDGLQDIYVCAAVADSANLRRNILYINKGIDSKTGIPHFEDEATSYGLDDDASTHMAAFFDYDKDGDLDVYLLENDLFGVNPNEFRPIKNDGSWPNTDKLMQNNYNEKLGHPVFTDVSKKAGILIEGYGLGVNITDINNDGWSDIFVSNDYVSNDLLYINNQNGTFTESAGKYFKHTSRNAMGNDVADINNDGRQDVIELDMAPADHYRQKMMNSPISYQNFQTLSYYGYMQQYVRNCLQLNMGPHYNENDSLSPPVFSEVGYLSGIAQTDWSWAPLAVDVDNDGFRDLMISNGLPKDLTDMDFIAYRSNAISNVSPEVMLKQLPTLKISNYIFKNNGNITFTDKTKEWGWDEPGYSAGMVYADLDKDGDMDVVVNNTEMEAFLMKNTINDEENEDGNYMNIKLQGDKLNTQAIGSSIQLYTNGGIQFYEYTPYRGYMSTIENVAHFGLGKNKQIDSVVVKWPNGRWQSIVQPICNSNLIIQYDSLKSSFRQSQIETPSSIFKECTFTSGVDYRSFEDEFIDFNVQRLIPHKLSQYAPALAGGDLNGDGLDDFIAGAGSPGYASIFFQNSNGTFSKSVFADTSIPKFQDDAGICLFDADLDGDNDIYIASGGNESAPQSKDYADHLYLNDGKGQFKDASVDIPTNLTSKSCVKPFDYDHDGDLDLFIGGRSIPGNYPKPASSIILRNDSKNGKLKFIDVTSTIAPSLVELGMVTDACWADVDNDNNAELIIVGEWMAPKIFSFNNGKLEKKENNISVYTGWWNSITTADIDNDGDLDLILGNYGMNGYINPSDDRPVKIYGKDFDNSMSYDAVVTNHVLSSINGKISEHPMGMRDDMIREMNFLRDRFPNFGSYAKATINDLLKPEELQGALILESKTFKTCWLENKGEMQFVMHELPIEAQFAPVYGIIARDVNGDGNIDLMMSSNEFSMTAGLGRYDAGNGLLLAGDGKGGFKTKSLLESGMYIPGNGKSLIEISINGKYGIVSGCNNGRIQLFVERSQTLKPCSINQNDISGISILKNGQARKENVISGSFFSQSAPKLWMNDAVKSMSIINTKGEKRNINH